MADPSERTRIQVPEISQWSETVQAELTGVPSFIPAFALIELRPEDSRHLFIDYQDLVRGIGTLTTAELATIEGAEQKLEEKRGVAGNASKVTTAEVVELFPKQEELDRIVERSSDYSGSAYSAAIADLVTKIKGGQALKKAGHKLRDGDDESDKVLWTYTDMSGSENLVHYLMAHYLERFFAADLPRMSEEAARVSSQKDFLLNAMTSVLIVDRMSEVNRFANIYESWARPREEAGMGWISNDRLIAFGLLAPPGPTLPQAPEQPSA